MESALRWQDRAVVIAYLVGMLGLGLLLSRRQKSDEEYFLGGRRMPWFAVGLSVIASLLSSLTYLSEPGEVWNAGITNIFGKLLAIPLEMVIVWTFCLPFMMRFRYTSAYEYLDQRFGGGARILGVVLFVVMVVLWMGFVVLASARALTTVSGVPLLLVILTVGVVATIYTMLGGLRAVVWTDVVQVLLLIGGGLFAIGYVAWATGTWVPQWYQTTLEHLRAANLTEKVPLFSASPLVRSTVVTVAINMCIWHVCTHTANQMTVQRYFSTEDQRAARRSFLTGSLVGAGINVMLVVVGLAMLHFYLGQGLPLDAGLDPLVKQQRDLIFPAFAIHRLPPGMGGGILAALLAAAMSSIDSGVNSIATVLSVEMRRGDWRRDRQPGAAATTPVSHVGRARMFTLGAGMFITVAAYGLSFLPDDWGILDAMPRTFNAITGPLGGMFLVGMFLPSVGQRAILAGTACGLATSVGIGYFRELGGLLGTLGLASQPWPSLSFTWVMPCSLAVTFVVAYGLSLCLNEAGPGAGLTWASRRQQPPPSQ